jgi:hypothetical protein
VVQIATTHLDVSLLNNSPETGEWSLGVLGGPDLTNPAVPRETAVGSPPVICSERCRHKSGFVELNRPVKLRNADLERPQRQTVTSTYEAVYYTAYCSIEAP